MKRHKYAKSSQCTISFFTHSVFFVHSVGTQEIGRSNYIVQTVNEHNICQYWRRTIGSHTDISQSVHRDKNGHLLGFCLKTNERPKRSKSLEEMMLVLALLLIKH